MTPNTGTYISGIGHGVLVLWALVGGLFLRANDPLPLQSTDVSLLTSEQFAALSAPQTSPDVPSEAPDEVAPSVQDVAPDVSPTVETVPEVVEPSPSISPPLEAAPQEPQPEPEPLPLVEVPEEAPVLPQPPAEQPSDAETVTPDATPQPAPASRVAPEAAAKPEPDAEISDTVTAEVAPDAEAEVVEEEKPATAPEEATTEIVTEAEKPSAPTTSVRPQSRPAPPPRIADTPAPEVIGEPENPVDDAVAAALAAATTSEAPSGPPLTGGEKDALRVAVQKCWNVGSLSTDALGTTVVVKVNMGRDSKPETGSIRMLSFEGGNEAAAAQAFGAARRAIIRCGASGFNLPVDKYSQWQTIEMTFNPERMRIK